MSTTSRYTTLRRRKERYNMLKKEAFSLFIITLFLKVCQVNTKTIFLIIATLIAITYISTTINNAYRRNGSEHNVSGHERVMKRLMISTGLLVVVQIFISQIW